jgi:hypothetical protein
MRIFYLLISYWMSYRGQTRYYDVQGAGLHHLARAEAEMLLRRNYASQSSPNEQFKKGNTSTRTNS